MWHVRCTEATRRVRGGVSAPGPRRSVGAGEARMAAAREARTAGARDSIRYWAGAVGAAAMVAGIVSVVVMVQMQKPAKTTKAAAPASRTAAAPQSRPGTPPAWTVNAAQQQKNTAPAQPRAEAPAQPRTEAASQPRTVASIQTTPKAQPEPKVVPAAVTLSDAERKLSEELWVEQKRLDTDSTKLTAKPDGRARMTTLLARQYNVQEKLVSDLHDRKLGYGEISASLAVSQQLMKHDKSTRQQALDRVLAARKAGQGWAAFSRGAGLKIGDVLDAVRKTDQQVAKAIG